MRRDAIDVTALHYRPVPDADGEVETSFAPTFDDFGALGARPTQGRDFIDTLEPLEDDRIDELQWSITRPARDPSRIKAAARTASTAVTAAVTARRISAGEITAAADAVLAAANGRKLSTPQRRMLRRVVG